MTDARQEETGRDHKHVLAATACLWIAACTPNNPLLISQALPQPGASSGYATATSKLANGFADGAPVLDFSPSSGDVFTSIGTRFGFANGSVDPSNFQVDVVDNTTVDVTYEGTTYRLVRASTNIEAQGSIYTGTVSGQQMTLTLYPVNLYENTDHVLAANITLAGDSIAAGNFGYGTDPTTLAGLASATYAGSARVSYEINNGAAPNTLRVLEANSANLSADFLNGTISGAVNMGAYSGANFTIGQGQINGNSFVAPISLDGGSATLGFVGEDVIQLPSAGTLSGGFYGSQGDVASGHTIMTGNAQGSGNPAIVQIGVFADKQ